MNLTDMLKAEAESAYRATEGLIKLVDADKLDWKPGTGDNWMTTGQLLRHLPTACGMCIKGFVTGDWGSPAETGGETGADDMMPTAKTMPTVKSVDEALKLLADDKAVALNMITEASEDALLNKKSAAPWGGPEQTLGHHLNQMIGHLSTHKAQLFYYLKQQGKPVNTMTMWGLE